jgi:hypothetical protein
MSYYKRPTRFGTEVPSSGGRSTYSFRHGITPSGATAAGRAQNVDNRELQQQLGLRMWTIESYSRR